MDKQTIIANNIKASISIKQSMLNNEALISQLEKAANAIVKSYKQGGKVLFCGNGGSAADAQHLAAELSGRFYYDRAPLHAEALSVNTSFVTAVANDYSYDMIFARMTRAAGVKGDVLVGLSTSGNSKNIVSAMEVAKELGLLTIGFTGKGGGAMKEHSDILIEIDSEDTARIQECQMLMGHSLCQLVESDLFPQK